MKKIFIALFGVFLLLGSCIIPEQFTCAVSVDKHGAYTIDFKGTILFYTALEEIKEQGAVSAEADQQIKEMFDEWIRQDPRIKKYAYRNSGRAYIEFYQHVTDGSSLDLSDEFNLPLRVNVYPDTITITEEAVDEESAAIIAEFVKLGYKLDGRINITSELPIIDSGRQKVGKKYIVFGPQVINQTFKTFPSMDVVIKIGRNQTDGAGRNTDRTASNGTSGSKSISDAIKAFFNSSGSGSNNSNNRTAPERTPTAKPPAASPPPSPPQNIFSPTHTVATNDGTKLRLRSSPSTKGDVIMSLDYGSSVQVLRLGDSFIDSDGNGGNWVYIATPSGNNGWCFGGYLKPLR
jgi:hypothetical protein